MIVMTPHATEAEIEAVRKRLATTGVHVVVMPGELTTAIRAIGDPEGVAELGLEGMAGVDRVVPISRPYKLASSELYHQQPTVLDRVARADARGGRGGEGGGRLDAARRRVQAAHLAVRLQGPRPGRPGDP